MVIFPELGKTSPVRHLNNVVFPAPETPRRAKHSPNSKPNEMVLTAVTSP